MAIPPLTQHGVLPPGTHDATLDEVEEMFGKHTERRVELFAKFLSFMAQARSFGLFSAFYIDGSFVTDKLSPGDIDGVLECSDAAFAKLSTDPRRRSMDPDVVDLQYDVQMFVQPPEIDDMRDFFSLMYEEDLLARKLPPGSRRGLVRVAL